MQKQGINITLPLINSTDFGFSPDEENDRIIYSIKAINGIGDDVARLIIKNRPYTSFDDFCERMVDTKLIKNSQMVKLIKAGCFSELHSEDRRETMQCFIGRYMIKPVEKLTFAQFDRLMNYDSKYHFIPKEVFVSIREKYFKEYVLDDRFLFKLYIDPKKRLPKCGYNDRWFKLDEDSMKFFQKNYSEDSIEAVEGTSYIISEKKFIKENDQKLIPLKEWMVSEDAIRFYNQAQLCEVWNDVAEGTVAHWEMEALSIYCTQEHELSGVDKTKYGIVDFFEEPIEPIAYDCYYRRVKQGESYVKKSFPKYTISRIVGTVLDKNKDRHMVSLLTPTGMVNVKFDKGQFSHYDRQMSERNNNGTKTITEKSWFTRGNKLIVCGFRQGDQFRAKKYVDTVWKHTCNLITQVDENGNINTQMERGGTDGR